MVRVYGDKPYQVVVVHGGPGAFGSVACIARELSKDMGVLEPIQSRYTISELVEELYEQVMQYARKPLTLIGHSWGAWLVIYFADQHPDLVQRLILVSSGPLKAEYVPLIMKRRLNNLSEEEGKTFLQCIRELEEPDYKEKDEALSLLGQLAEKSDNFDIEKTSEEDTQEFTPDGKMYSSVWPEADELRRNEELYRAAGRLQCPITVIGGEVDSHPVEGVIEPLIEQGLTVDSHILSRCGHSPFLEKHAKEDFYQIIRDSIQK